MGAPGRNDPCPCGSGQKYRDCCRRRDKRLAPTVGSGLGVKPGAPGGKKLLLVFPPYTIATSPPLGVCHLKGYVERHLPQWEVKVADLNLHTHQQHLARLGAPVRPERFAFDNTNLRWAAEFFRGRERESLHDKRRYLHYAQVWAQAMPDAIAPSKALEETFRKRETPAWVRAQARLILKEKPDAIGISICYNRQLWPALSLARAIRAMARVPVIMGGTFFNDGVPADWGKLHHLVDYAVVGAGERPLVEILAGRADHDTVPGVARILPQEVKATPALYDQDLDELGKPDFSDLPLDLYYSPAPILPVGTSRGCYWRRCAFCAHFRSSGQTYQTRSVAPVVEELAEHAERGHRHFYMTDSVISPARFSALADGIIEAGLDIRYYAMARPEHRFNRDLLSRMHRSGCRFILWGFESGCQRVLDLMDKGTQITTVEKVLREAHEAGIHNHVFTICGFPSETQEEFQETLDFLARNRPWLSVVHRTMFQLEASTPVHSDPAAFSITRMRPLSTPGLLDFETDHGMTRQEARAFFKEARGFLRSFSGHPAIPGDFKFRDHSLFEYSRGDDAPGRGGGPP